MRRRLIPLIALLMILAVVAVAYSIAMSIDDVGGLGATDYVDVTCPAKQSCQLDKIR